MRNLQPWQRKSTGTWHVWFNGKQRYLGNDEEKARETFRRMTQSGATGDFTVRQIVQAYWRWAKKNLAESTCRRRKPILEAFSRAMRAVIEGRLAARHARPGLAGRVRREKGVGPFSELLKIRKAKHPRPRFAKQSRETECVFFTDRKLGKLPADDVPVDDDTAASAA